MGAGPPHAVAVPAQPPAKAKRGRPVGSKRGATPNSAPTAVSLEPPADSAQPRQPLGEDADTRQPVKGRSRRKVAVGTATKASDAYEVATAPEVAVEPIAEPVAALEAAQAAEPAQASPGKHEEAEGAAAGPGTDSMAGAFMDSRAGAVADSTAGAVVDSRPDGGRASVGAMARMASTGKLM